MKALKMDVQFFAKWSICKQISSRKSEDETKNNTRKYFKMIKRRQSDRRQKDKMESHIRTLKEEPSSAETIALIHSLQLLNADDEESSSSSDYSSDDDE